MFIKCKNNDIKKSGIQNDIALKKIEENEKIIEFLNSMGYKNIKIEGDLVMMEKIKLDKIESITFNNVTFKHADGNLPKGTNNINIEIKKDKNKSLIVIVLGKTGSGKSSIFYLLLNLFKAKYGDIKYNNIPIEHIDEDDLYSKSIIMLQFTKFIRTSLSNSIGSVINKTNIKNGEIVAKEKNLIPDPILYKHEENKFYKYLIDKSIEESGLKPFIDGFPQKEHTIIVDNGANLSGGMRQMLSLARSLIQIYYTRALNLNKILCFFDEPIASIDIKNAQIVLKTIINVIADLNCISFISDHTGYFLKLAVSNETICNNIDFKILFVTDDGVIYGSIDDLKNNPEFMSSYSSFIQ